MVNLEVGEWDKSLEIVKGGIKWTVTHGAKGAVTIIFALTCGSSGMLHFRIIVFYSKIQAMRIEVVGNN